MKEALLNNWTFMRFLRLVAGIAIFVQAVINKDILFGIAGLTFTAMAVFNIGCCGASGCYTPVKKNTETAKDITYEEVV